MAEELVAMPAPSLVPPGRFRFVQVAPAFEEPGRLLLVGDPLPDKTQRQLSPISMRRVSSLAGALEAMEEHPWRLVVVSPRVRETTDGLRFVHAFKAARPLDGVAYQALRRRYAAVPFLIQPLPGDTEFAVFYSATEWCLGDTDTTPLVSTIRLLCR